jgi:hypothetical protein
MKKLKKAFTITNLLLVLAAGFASYNFGLAGGFIEGKPQGQVSFGGLIAGVVVNISLVVASSRLGSVKGVLRQKQAKMSLWALLVLSPLMVSPVVYYQLPETFLNSWLRGLWSIGWPLVADVAIVAAGSVTGKSLISLGSDAPATSSVAKPRSKRRSATTSDANSRSSDAPATLNEKESDAEARIYRCICGFETENRNRYSGHTGKCEMYQKSKKEDRQLIPVDLSPSKKAGNDDES